jgi:hypothetical protein
MTLWEKREGDLGCSDRQKKGCSAVMDGAVKIGRGKYYSAEESETNFSLFVFIF